MANSLDDEGTPQAVNRRVVMTAVTIGLFLASLNQTMVGTALPQIVASLGGLDLYAWVFSIYMLGLTALIPVFGKLSDQFGRRPVFLFGLLLFTLGALFGGMARTMPELIAARGLQGVGAGGVIPIAFAIVGDLYTPVERGKVQGAIGAAFGVSSLIGPLAGGWITDHIGWRWSFWVNVPIGVLALVVAIATLPKLARPKRVKVDVAGTLLLLGSLTPLMLVLGLGGHQLAWTSPVTIGLAVLSVVLGLAFVAVEKRAAEPIVPLGLFRRDIFAVSAGVSFLIGVIMFTNTMVLPLFLQGVQGDTATEAGLMLTALVVSMVIASTLSGILASRTGRYRTLVLGGMALMTVGGGLLATLGPATPAWAIALYLVIGGFGLGITMPLFVLAVQNDAPAEQLGVVTSLVQFFRNIGGTIGVAVMGALLTLHTQLAMQARFPDTVPPDPQALLVPGGAGDIAPETLLAMREALAHALQLLFVYGFAVAALALVWAFWLREQPLRGAHPPSLQEAGQELAAEGLVAGAQLRPEDEPQLVDRD